MKKGAFTGAMQRRVGRFELARGRGDLPGRGRRTTARDSSRAAAGVTGTGERRLNVFPLKMPPLRIPDDKPESRSP
jgi:hypothetical protein